jgi:hypothetical protein
MVKIRMQKRPEYNTRQRLKISRINTKSVELVTRQCVEKVSKPDHEREYPDGFRRFYPIGSVYFTQCLQTCCTQR